MLKKFDNDVYLKEVEQIRQQGLGHKGHNKLVGRIQMHLVAQRIKEAGLAWSDTQGAKGPYSQENVIRGFRQISGLGGYISHIYGENRNLWGEFCKHLPYCPL